MERSPNLTFSLKKDLMMRSDEREEKNALSVCQISSLPKNEGKNSQAPPVEVMIEAEKSLFRARFVIDWLRFTEGEGADGNYSF